MLSFTTYAQNKIFSSLHIEAGAATNVKNFRWSIAGHQNGQDPNILSELIYKNIIAAGGFLKVTYQPFKNFAITTAFNKTSAFKGKATDTDYDGDNRTLPKPNMPLQLNSNKGFSRNAAAGITYAVAINRMSQVIFGAGHASLKDELKTAYKNTPDINSIYTSTWNGPYTTVSATLHIKKLSAETGMLVQHIKYRSKANWIDITDFAHPVSFIQTANGYGIHPFLNMGFALTQKWQITLNSGYQHYKTHTGVDVLYKANGTTVNTQFNGAVKNNFYIFPGLNFQLL